MRRGTARPRPPAVQLSAWTLWTRRNSCAERPGEARPQSAFQRGGQTETEQLAAGFRATERARPGPRALHPGVPSWAARGRDPPCGHQQCDWWGPGWVQPSEPSPARWKTRDLQAGDATIGVRPAGDSLERLAPHRTEGEVSTAVTVTMTMTMTDRRRCPRGPSRLLSLLREPRVLGVFARESQMRRPCPCGVYGLIEGCVELRPGAPESLSLPRDSLVVKLRGDAARPSEARLRRPSHTVTEIAVARS